MERTILFKARAVMVLLVAVFTTSTAIGAAKPIDLTFTGTGSSSTVESVTVTNLTHTDIAAVTLSGTATLRLKDVNFLEGDVNLDKQVGIGDIVAITNVMAGTDADVNIKDLADVNGDGTVGIGDIVAITNIMAGGSTGGTNVVTMDFHAGDVLRFEGKSGTMSTLVVNAPKRNHSIPFCFYPCVDAAGNTYPIIEAGGLLWMAEDLKTDKAEGVSFIPKSRIASWANAAANNGTSSLALKLDEGDVYYTYDAAKKALPEGWALPTLGELDAVVKQLGGYDVAGEKMQRAGDDESFLWKLSTNPDSLQLRINPKGYIGEDGMLADIDNGYIMTGTLLKQRALYMKLVDGKKEGVLTSEGLSRYVGVHVRGVRPAPSPYTDMMVQLCGGNAAGARAAALFKAEEEGSAEVNP